MLGIRPNTSRRYAAHGPLDAAKLLPGLNSPHVASPARVSRADRFSRSRHEGAQQSRLQVEETDSDEEDPFAAVEAEELGDGGGSDDDLAPEALARDQLARQAALVTDLVSRIEHEDWRKGGEGKRAALQLVRTRR